MHFNHRTPSSSARSRLAVFSASWYPVEGGAEQQLRRVVTGLGQSGWAVDVITGTHDARFPENHPELRVHGPGSGPEPPTAATNIKGPNLASRSVAAGLRAKPDVILASLVSATTLAAVTVGRLLRKPVVLRLGGRDLDRLATPGLGRFQARYVLSSTALVVVNADHLADQLDPFARHGLPPVLTIRNGVDEAPPRPQQEQRLGPLRVLYYTNGGKAKNDPGFAEVVRSRPDILFRAVGSTAHLPGEPNLDRFGWCDDVPSQMEWADAVINTSLSEGSPNFCLQAIACRRPVVGYGNEGVRELQQQFPEAVRVVEQGDLAAMGAALSEDLRYLQVDPSGVRRTSDVTSEWDTLLRALTVRDRRAARWPDSAARLHRPNR